MLSRWLNDLMNQSLENINEKRREKVVITKREAKIGH